MEVTDKAMKKSLMGPKEGTLKNLVEAKYSAYVPDMNIR